MAGTKTARSRCAFSRALLGRTFECWGSQLSCAHAGLLSPCIYTYIYIYIYIHTLYIYISLQIRMYVCMYVCMYIHTHTHGSLRSSGDLKSTSGSFQGAPNCRELSLKTSEELPRAATLLMPSRHCMYQTCITGSFRLTLLTFRVPFHETTSRWRKQTFAAHAPCVQFNILELAPPLYVPMSAPSS